MWYGILRFSYQILHIQKHESWSSEMQRNKREKTYMWARGAIPPLLSPPLGIRTGNLPVHLSVPVVDLY